MSEAHLVLCTFCKHEDKRFLVKYVPASSGFLGIGARPACVRTTCECCGAERDWPEGAIAVRRPAPPSQTPAATPPGGSTE